MIVLLLAINLGISWLNCYSVGGIWAESKALGGFVRLLAWCGAIQAAIGFSSVIGFGIGYVVYSLGYLTPEAAKGAVSLWYLLIIIPALGTGFILMINSWIVAYRERSLLNMGTAAWNTFAQFHNMYSAIDGIGDAFQGVGKMFDGDTDKEGVIALLAVAIVGVSLFGGVLLTAYLIKKYAGRLPVPTRDHLRA